MTVKDCKNCKRQEKKCKIQQREIESLWRQVDSLGTDLKNCYKKMQEMYDSH